MSWSSAGKGGLIFGLFDRVETRVPAGGASAVERPVPFLTRQAEQMS